MLDFLSILGIVALCVALALVVILIIPCYLVSRGRLGYLVVYVSMVVTLAISGVVFYENREENRFDALSYIYEHSCRLTNRERGPSSTILTMVNNVPITTVVQGDLHYRYECRDGDFWR